VLAGVLVFASAPALASKGVVGYFGGTGTAGGLFSTPGGVAVNDTSGNVYVVDSGNDRVQEFSTGGAFVRAWGAGVVIPGGVTGTGTLADNSTTITSVVTTSRAFLVGQTIAGTGILAGTTIMGVGSGTITLSQPTTATAAGVGVVLTVPENAGNVPVNALQTVTLGSGATGGTFTLTFSTPDPSPTSDETAAIAYNAPAAGAGSVQEALEDLANIGAGNVAVTGSAGGPWTVEFTGTPFADTDVAQMTANAKKLKGVKTAEVATLREAASAFEVCGEAASCEKGVASAEAGGISTPEGVAVEQVTGDVYVTDQGNHRVDEFSEDGAFVRAFGWGVGTGAASLQVCTTTCEAGLSGAGAGEFGASIGYPAVDPVTGDVYVADSANRRVDVFEGDGVFERAFGWGVTNGAGEFQLCTSTCQAGVASSTETNLGRFATGSPTRVALDASGEVYVVDGGSPDFRVQKFGPVAAGNAPLAEFFASAYLTGSSSATAPSDVALEPALGSVFGAREPSSPAEHLVYELGSTGGLLETFGEGAALPAPNGLAVGPSGASVYFSTATGSRVLVLGTTVPPTATVEAATGLSASEVTLRGTVDPNETPPNKLETAWWFEYSTNQTEWARAPAGRLAAATSPVAVAQTVTGLEGGTVYYVRLRAEKEYAAGSVTSTTVLLTTAAAAPSISGESVSEVKATSATFSAQVNPEHLATTYHFEYETTPYTTGAAHGTSIPVPGDDIGAGLGEVPVSQHPQSLKPDTTYHYRVVAANATATTDGPEQTFTTQTRGEEIELLDGRAWEMVSPPDKNGARIKVMWVQGGGVEQAAAGGGAFTWSATAPLGTEVEGNRSIEVSQIFSTRGTDGWSSRDLTPPSEAPSNIAVGAETPYPFFSSDLSLGVIEPTGETLLSPEATEKTLYLREDAASSFLPLVTAANVPPGTKFGIAEGDTKESAVGMEFRGATPDLSHVVLSYAGEGLTSHAPTGANLYEWAGGRLKLVNVLPDGKVSSGSPALGNQHETGDLRHAISSDGSRVIWSTEATSESHLYMRDTTKGETNGETGETIQLDVPEESVKEPGKADAVLQTSSANAHRVFFTDTQKLTEDSGAAPGKADLYMFETTNGEDEPLKGTLTDLTAAHDGESAGVTGFLPGAGEDGSYVYLVAGGVLSEAANGEHEKAVSGSSSLYVLHDTEAGWTTTFIARLSTEDENDLEHRLAHLTARVSPDGRYLAFMSDRELTGYDNRDANSGVPDEEVFLYDAEAGGGAGRLVCASCNPTGARPDGMEDHESGDTAPLVDEGEVWNGRWLAASIPGWTPVDNSGLAFYQSRYLSDNGRLFFNSSDALVPQDVNGTEDVYEYEPSGEGTCATSSVTFSERSGGCVDLISSGTSSEESVFLDASEEGEEVFFATAAKLVPQDYEAALAVYDARECTAQSPCVAPPSEAPPACTTPEACRAPSGPQSAIFGAPPSQTFSGAGNATPAPAASTKSKAKPLMRPQKLAKALQACKRKPKKKQRLACEKQAHKAYGAAKAKKTKLEGKKTSRGRK
jgi:DNA-binding beta-propeller fold protein YncE